MKRPIAKRHIHKCVGLGYLEGEVPWAYFLERGEESAVISFQELAADGSWTRIREEARLPQSTWAKAESFAFAFLTQEIKSAGVLPGRIPKTGDVIVGDSIGHELILLFWALADAENPERVLQNWAKFATEERWWMHSMARRSQTWKTAIVMGLGSE
jgi:hypothetical protein